MNNASAQENFAWNPTDSSPSITEEKNSKSKYNSLLSTYCMWHGAGCRRQTVPNTSISSALTTFESLSLPPPLSPPPPPCPDSPGKTLDWLHLPSLAHSRRNAVDAIHVCETEQKSSRKILKSLAQTLENIHTYSYIYLND